MPQLHMLTEILSLAFLFRTVQAKNLCAVQGQGSAIVGERLWFSGGAYTFDDGEANTGEDSLFSLDLTTAFPAHSFISDTTYDTIPLPSGVPNNATATDTVMFNTNTSLSMLYPSTSNPLDMWIYNVSTNDWTQSVAQDSIGPGVWEFSSSNRLQAVSIPSVGISYYAGTSTQSLAKRDGETYPWLESLDQNGGLEWHGINTQTPVPLVDSTLTYIRAGKSGVLLALGGTNPDSREDDDRDMTNIFVYDIDSTIWYNVTAAGYTDDTDVPDPRSSYCAGVSTAPDDSTIQVTIYGGYSSEIPQAYNDVYVLSIPSFTWFNMTPLDQGLGDGVDSGRAFHQCLMGSDAQMIVLGGQTESISDAESWDTGCNQSHPPLLVLNTNTYQWEDSFNPHLTYTVPSRISNDLGQDPASASPSAGWSDDALESIFAQRVPYTPLPSLQPAIAKGTTGANGTASASSSRSRATTPSHTGAIVGGVVGGIGGLAILGGIAYYFARRTRHRRQQYKNVELSKSAASDHDYQTPPYVAPQEMEGGSRPAEADAGNYLREAPGDIGLYSKVFEMQGD
ncbi:hypothetical protein EV356DRAFT_528862 [Viridothelium virens]|uniref:Galactose oxidase n=1 Tax=Viridothelium virens TaxID=1048519 RepID=A0A6A6HME5_VIRVR|nr:hypothetical protein EV356DRAFT_528862 [Viridothelium virens]